MQAIHNTSISNSQKKTPCTSITKHRWLTSGNNGYSFWENEMHYTVWVRSQSCKYEGWWSMQQPPCFQGLRERMWIKQYIAKCLTALQMWHLNCKVRMFRYQVSVQIFQNRYRQTSPSHLHKLLQGKEIWHISENQEKKLNWRQVACRSEHRFIDTFPKYNFRSHTTKLWGTAVA